MSGPTEIPTLDQLAADPLAGELSPATLAALLSRAAGVQATLQSRLAAALNNGHRNGAEAAAAPVGQMLTADEAAEIVGGDCTPRWILDHCRKLPFAKGVSRKLIRFEEKGLREWLKTRRP